MSKQKEGLGKGIRALLQGIDEDVVAPKGRNADNSAAAAFAGEPANNAVAIDLVKLTEIEVNPFQPRVDFDEQALSDLSESIKTHGLIQPITLRRITGQEYKYQLISGERRLRASKLAGLTEVPAYIRTANDQEMVEMALVENIQREDLNDIEVAITYQRLKKECALTDEQVAARVGKNRSTVTHFLNLLKLPEVIQIALKERKISMGHARAINGLEHVDQQLLAYKKLIENKFSVRQMEMYVQSIKAVRGGAAKVLKTPSGADANGLTPGHLKIQAQMTTKLGTRIKMTRQPNGKGEISIPFASDDDLTRIIQLLNI